VAGNLSILVALDGFGGVVTAHVPQIVVDTDGNQDRWLEPNDPAVDPEFVVKRSCKAQYAITVGWVDTRPLDNEPTGGCGGMPYGDPNGQGGVTFPFGRKPGFDTGRVAELPSPFGVLEGGLYIPGAKIFEVKKGLSCNGGASFDPTDPASEENYGLRRAVRFRGEGPGSNWTQWSGEYKGALALENLEINVNPAKIILTDGRCSNGQPTQECSGYVEFLVHIKGGRLEAGGATGLPTHGSPGSHGAGANNPLPMPERGGSLEAFPFQPGGWWSTMQNNTNPNLSIFPWLPEQVRISEDDASIVEHVARVRVPFTGCGKLYSRNFKITLPWGDGYEETQLAFGSDHKRLRITFVSYCSSCYGS
jgi:hypothetical protein